MTAEDYVLLLGLGLGLVALSEFCTWLYSAVIIGALTAPGSA